DSVPLKSNLKDEQATAKADVFFIHPTIFTYTPINQYQWNGDVNDQVLNTKTQLSTILNQASIFNGSCKIYAPYYRQAHYHAFITTNRDDAKRALEAKRLKQFGGACAALVGIFVILVAIEFVSIGTIA
ncbi:MAG: DUF3089 domain-containing protein, partial [Erythrobacter sp.]